MNNEISQIKQLFASHQIPVSQIWLESCISWCREESLRPNYTIKDLENVVYEQWLLLDLRELELATLPKNISNKKHFILNDNYCLQVMQVIDISKPKLWQLQKIRNSHALTKSTLNDAETVGTAKRMLQLTLTDGVQEVEAMEFRPIPSISINLTPGHKVRIIGPVTVRRGRIMLEEKNIRPLGGEVEELAIVNAPENVLARFLKLPENPNPTRIDERMLTVEKENQNEGYKPVSHFSKPQIAPKASLIDEDVIDQEIELLMEVERDMAPQPRDETPDIFEDMDIDYEQLDKLAEVHSNFEKAKQDYEAPKPDSQSSDVFDDIDIDAHLDQIDKKTQKTFKAEDAHLDRIDDFLDIPLRTLQKPKIISIASLLSQKEHVSDETFRVKAKFKSVIEKLTLQEDEYRLIIQVEDSTGAINVQLHSDIVSSFAGLSPAEIMKCKNNILKNGNDEKVVAALETLKRKLLSLDNEVEIRICDKTAVLCAIL